MREEKSGLASWAHLQDVHLWGRLDLPARDVKAGSPFDLIILTQDWDGTINPHWQYFLKLNRNQDKCPRL